MPHERIDARQCRPRLAVDRNDRQRADAFPIRQNPHQIAGSQLVFDIAGQQPDDPASGECGFAQLFAMEPLEFNLAGHPEIFIVSNVEEGGKAVGLKRAGWGWHSDGEDKAIPNAGSFLYAHEVPPEGAIRCLPTPTRRLPSFRPTCSA